MAVSIENSYQCLTAVARRPEVGSTSFALVTFAANSAAREAPRATETAVQWI